MLQEFRDFLNRGNVIDVAVGFVMGIAFTTIVTAIVEGLVNPLVALVIPGLDDLGQWEVGSFALGRVLSAIINFVAVGLVFSSWSRRTTSSRGISPPPPRRWCSSPRSATS